MTRFLKRVSLKMAALGLVELAIMGGATHAQVPEPPITTVSGSKCVTAPPSCAMPAPPVAGMPMPGQPGAMPTPEGGPTPPTPETPSLPSESSSAGGGETGLAAPFMIGDLLYASRSLKYDLGRISGNSSPSGLGATSIVNASVAENNSPIPLDRVYFRYNFFHDSQSVTGYGSPPTGAIPGFALTDPRQVLLYPPQTKQYNTNLYTFGGEKTLLDGQMSVEVRLPIISTLSPHNAISVGSITGPESFFGLARDGNGNPQFGTQATPGDTLGRQDTYFDNMMVILKGLLYRSDDRTLSVSAGAGFGIPTAPDTRVTLSSFAGNLPTVAGGIESRDITIANSTWAVSPFLAGLWLPSERFFTQGFLQVECPLNSSSITYSDQFPVGRYGNGGFTNLVNALATGQSLKPPFTYHTRIDEQYLLHGDVGTGYWLVRLCSFSCPFCLFSFYPSPFRFKCPCAATSAPTAIQTILEAFHGWFPSSGCHWRLTPV